MKSEPTNKRNHQNRASQRSSVRVHALARPLTRDRSACLWLRLEGTPGDTYQGIAWEMAMVATRLNLPVQVNFNGYQMLAMPGELPQNIMAALERQMAPSGEKKVA